MIRLVYIKELMDYSNLDSTTAMSCTTDVNNIDDVEAISYRGCQYGRGQRAESAAARLADCFIAPGLVYL